MTQAVYRGEPNKKVYGTQTQSETGA